MPAHQGDHRTDRLGLGARDQARRLPPDGAADPAGIRIKTRRGFDWTDRYPQIVEAAERLRATSIVLDREGVILRPDGVADFDRLHA